ncbi:5-oxoprolinase subunit PxpB [Salipaludibacillus daqingensis]|uniref:5-oxoprolinase subunit PxpB n=1 Tax=Salipaludibacillus daqingensis TaxID=3041001 RepID=UPI002475D1B8|nr:5-oxoprolinase subunit PxpB [Salipaludibacillus daqingensis]
MEQRFAPVGDQAIRIAFGETISKETNRAIRAFCELLKKSKLDEVIEWVPSYSAVTVYYKPTEIRYAKIVQKMEELLTQLIEMDLPPAKRVIVPVCYEGKFAPDLEEVAKYHQLSVDEVIKIHTNGDYLIYMLGFTPGFPYMGGMSKEIATPRLENPRSLVPAGSVGIAGEQTGIYSLDTPGGWQVIGRTPLVLYDGKRENPSLFEAGDHVRFRSISLDEYEEIRRQLVAKTYEIDDEIVKE